MVTVAPTFTQGTRNQDQIVADPDKTFRVSGVSLSTSTVSIPVTLDIHQTGAPFNLHQVWETTDGTSCTNGHISEVTGDITVTCTITAADGGAVTVNYTHGGETVHTDSNVVHFQLCVVPLLVWPKDSPTTPLTFTGGSCTLDDCEHKSFGFLTASGFTASWTATNASVTAEDEQVTVNPTAESVCVSCAVSNGPVPHNFNIQLTCLVAADEVSTGVYASADRAVAAIVASTQGSIRLNSKPVFSDNSSAVTDQLRVLFDGGPTTDTIACDPGDFRLVAHDDGFTNGGSQFVRITEPALAIGPYVDNQHNYLWVLPDDDVHSTSKLYVDATQNFTIIGRTGRLPENAQSRPYSRFQATIAGDGTLTTRKRDSEGTRDKAVSVYGAWNKAQWPCLHWKTDNLMDFKYLSLCDDYGVPCIAGEYTRDNNNGQSKKKLIFGTKEMFDRVFASHQTPEYEDYTTTLRSLSQPVFAVNQATNVTVVLVSDGIVTRKFPGTVELTKGNKFAPLLLKYGAATARVKPGHIQISGSASYTFYAHA